MWLIILFVVICIIGASISMKNDEEQAKEMQNENFLALERINNEYRDKLKNYRNLIAPDESIEKQAKVNVITIGYRENIYHLPHYVWKHKDILYFFPTGQEGTFDNHTGEPLHMHTYRVSVTDMTLIRIPIDKIMFYRQIGSVYTTISGSGGHSSFSPVTGFHGKINPIEIKSSVHDERTTQIFYSCGASNETVVLEDKDYYILRRLIPQKDYQVVTTAESSKPQKTDEFDRLKKINEMHKAGLISDSDYEQKKSEILNTL